MTEMLVIPSPLKTWPGEIKLPQPDDFSGVHWQVWKDSINQPRRKAYLLFIHLYSYAGLELIQAAGEWEIDIPLAEVQTWEDNPEAERIKLLAWLGRTMSRYIDSITDPKD